MDGQLKSNHDESTVFKQVIFNISSYLVTGNQCLPGPQMKYCHCQYITLELIPPARCKNTSLCDLYPQSAVKSKLRNKLRNERHRHPAEERSGAKRARLSGEAAAAAGLPNYTADAEDDELVDATYILKNKEDLSSAEAVELKKKTFVARRTMLTKRKEPLTALKERFPWLFDSNEVRASEQIPP